MRIEGPSGRGERARVARRVRALLGSEGSESDVLSVGALAGYTATGDELVGDDLVGDDSVGLGRVGGRLIGGRQERWLPSEEFEQAGRTAPRTARALRGVRWDPSRRSAAAMGLAAVAVVVLTLWWLLVSRPHAMAVTGSGAVGATSAATRSASRAVSAAASGSAAAASGSAVAASGSAVAAATATVVVVDVAGKVRRPGIYGLPPGSRVFDALRAAGGARPGVSTMSLNLAAPLSDGEQIVVGVAGPSGGSTTVPATSAGNSDGTGSASRPGPVHLNSATLEQLETLPGVGPVLGQHILDWRDAHGHFATLDQLREVSGIGPAKFASIRGLVAL